MPKQQTFRIHRDRDGSEYEVYMNPGEYISFAADESLIVPEPPKLDTPVAVTVLNDHERRIKWLEEVVASLSRRLPNTASSPELLPAQGGVERT